MTPTAQHEAKPRNGILTLVVEDEPLALRRVLRLLDRDPEIAIVGTCASVTEALTVAANLTPELVLLDVRMPERDGFELLKALRKRGVDPLVVFITAYSEHAVAAFELDAVDYILKPFDDARFAKALARVKSTVQSTRTDVSVDNVAVPARSLTAVGSSPAARDRLLLTENGRVLFLPIRDIEFVQAAAKHIKIFAQGRCHLLRQPLCELEARLDPNQFVRIHRSTIVNVEKIVEMHPLFHGDFELLLTRGTRVVMSRRFRTRMLPFTFGRWPT